MTLPTHQPWCAAPAAIHATCRRLMADVDVSYAMRITVELSKTDGTTALVSVVIHRGARTALVPLAARSAAVIGTALADAARLAGEV